MELAPSVSFLGWLLLSSVLPLAQIFLSCSRVPLWRLSYWLLPFLSVDVLLTQQSRKRSRCFNQRLAKQLAKVTLGIGVL